MMLSLSLLSEFATEVFYPCKIAILCTREPGMLELKEKVETYLTRFKNLKVVSYEAGSIFQIPFLMSRLTKTNYNYTYCSAYICLGHVDRSTDSYCSVYDALMKFQVDLGEPVINGLVEEYQKSDEEIVYEVISSLLSKNKIMNDQKFNR